jgi:acetyl-CoA C-acetyltransferase
MRAAAIVSTARTPIGKAFRGAFNKTHGATMMGHAIEHAVARAGIDPAEVEDVVIGCGFPEGATGFNLARQAALRAGLPVTTSGTTINRFCSSGLQAISVAAQRVVVDAVPVMVAGGIEQISLTQPTYNVANKDEPWLRERVPTLHMPMIDTAEVVAKRYGIGREAQDAYALESQRRTAAAQQAGRFDDEIVPLPTVKEVVDKASGAARLEPVTLARDEGNRPDTSPEGLAKLEPVRGSGFTVTAGNASQLSDGASACVVMEATLAEKRGLAPLGLYKGMAVAGCEPDEMGIGPVFAVPRLLERHGLGVADIDLWELNEAFASVVLRFMQALDIDHKDINVNGGAIAMGHPLGATGAMIFGTMVDELERSGKSTALITLCIGAGMGTATIIERV